MTALRLGEMLVSQGLLDAPRLRSALALQSRFGGKLGDILVDAGYVDRESLAPVLAARLGVDFVHLGPRQIPAEVLGALPRDVVVRHRVLPIHLVRGARRNTLVVACADPGNEDVRRALRAHARVIDVRFVLATPGDLGEALVANGLVHGRREIELTEDDADESAFVIERAI